MSLFNRKTVLDDDSIHSLHNDMVSLFGGGSDTVETKTAPWEELQPYLTGTPGVEAGAATPGGYVTEIDPFTGQEVQVYQPGTPATEAIPGTPGLFPEAQSLYEEGQQSYYPGQTYADFTQAQQQGQTGALNFAQGAMQDTANSALGANRLMTSGDLLYANSNPYLQQNISDANSLIARDFNENIVPGISRAAQGAGQYGSSREGIAQGIAGRGAAEAMTRNTNQMMNQAYGTGLNAMATGVGQTQGALAAGLSPYQAMQDVGGIQQQQSQLGVNDAVNAYNFNQQAPWNNLQNYMSALTGNYLGSGGTATQPVTGGSPIMAGLGGAATAAAFTSNPWMIGGAGVAGLLSS
jgi:hypothetical protein